MSTALEIKNIEKRFGSRTVLNKISFETKTSLGVSWYGGSGGWIYQALSGADNQQ